MFVFIYFYHCRLALSVWWGNVTRPATHNQRVKSISEHVNALIRRKNVNNWWLCVKGESVDPADGTCAQLLQNSSPVSKCKAPNYCNSFYSSCIGNIIALQVEEKKQCAFFFPNANIYSTKITISTCYLLYELIFSCISNHSFWELLHIYFTWKYTNIQFQVRMWSVF